MDAISRSLSEIRDNNKLILSRCDEFCRACEPECQCNAKLELNRKEVYDLKTKCITLENACKRHEQETENLKVGMRDLKDQLDKIQRTLQTDDVKLRTTKSCPVSSKKQTERVQETRITESVIKGGFVKQNNFDNEKEFDNSDDESWIGTNFGQTEGAMITKSEPDSTNYVGTKTVECKSSDEDLPESATVQVDLIKQVKQRVALGDLHWRLIAQEELNESRNLFNELKGVHTILCLDISESMLENNGWKQASTFVKDYLNGLSEIAYTDGYRNEFVAIVTFGHETAVKQRYSNNCEELMHVFNDLRLGGPSSLYGGLLLSQAAVRCSRFIGFEFSRNILAPSRIIIITDGRPSDINVIAGPDTITSNEEQTKRYIVNELCQHNVMINDIFVVPVGNADSEFVDVMIGVSGGMKMDHTHGRRLSRRAYLSQNHVVDLGGRLGILPSQSERLTAEDQDDMSSIFERSKRLLELLRPPSHEEYYHERPRSQLPTIGCRVRRGPDWNRNQQDRSGPGTVIGHAKESDDIYIEWDEDARIGIYRYGETGYDVLIVDEVRELQDGGMLAVGCNVKPGKVWNKPESKPRRGIVIKIDSTTRIATVRWENARRGDFSLDLEKGELEYCPTLDRHSEDSVVGNARHETRTNLHTDEGN